MKEIRAKFAKPACSRKKKQTPTIVYGRVEANTYTYRVVSNNGMIAAMANKLATAKAFIKLLLFMP